MNTRTIARISVASGAAVLCLGVVSPTLAAAHTTTPTTGTTAPAPTETLATVVARIDAAIAARVATVTAKAAQVAADPTVSDAQKAEFAAKTDAKLTKLATVKTEVDSATTLEQLKQELAAQQWHHDGDGAHDDGWNRQSFDSERKGLHSCSTPVGDPSPASTVVTSKTMSVALTQHGATVVGADYDGKHRVNVSQSTIVASTHDKSTHGGSNHGSSHR